MAKGGLGKWFGEEWTDVKTGKPCGRSGKNDNELTLPVDLSP